MCKKQEIYQDFYTQHATVQRMGEGEGVRRCGEERRDGSHVTTRNLGRGHAPYVERIKGCEWGKHVQSLCFWVVGQKRCDIQTLPQPRVYNLLHLLTLDEPQTQDS